MSKPFSLQSPEQIAKEYGGNKQKIAQAMQMGIVDPTAGTLAGMFIDRMRSAQVQEAANPPTVAQQVFAPPPPPGMPPGPPMGAPPQGGPPAPPMGGMPPAPPMGGGMPPAPPMGAPPAPPMGMADGGLAALPIPDQMFDEPTNGGFDDGYANGGIVAFARGDEVDYEKILRDRMAALSDPDAMLADYNRLYQPQRQYAEQANQLNKDLMSPEGQKKRRDEDKWFALAQLGATMASTPGSLIQAASAGLKQALPGLQEANKERRAEVRDALKQLVADENMTNAERRAFVSEAMKGKGEGAKIAADLYAAQEQMKQLGIKETGDTLRANIAAQASRDVAATNARSYANTFDKQAQQQVFTAVTNVVKGIEDEYSKNPTYRELLTEYSSRPETMAPARLQKLRQFQAQKAKDTAAQLEMYKTTAPAGTVDIFDRAIKQALAGASPSTVPGGLVEGRRAKDRQGRDIVVMNGQWVYP